MSKFLLATTVALFLSLAIHPVAGGETGCGFENESADDMIGTCGREEEPAEVILTGALTVEDLRRQPGFDEKYASYQPDPDELAALRAIATPVELVAIVGTWCPDCHRETPRLAKILRATDNPNLSIRYIGIDRTRSDPEGLATAYDFQRIPTILVFRDGQELGRIVESPEVSLEHDLVRILGS